MPNRRPICTLNATPAKAGIFPGVLACLAALLVSFALTFALTGCADQGQDQTDAANDQGQPSESTSSQLRVHFIDVGQGDSEFLELPNGKTMLIDAGEREAGPTVVSYIRSLGYSSIDYVVATHPHSDHIGGFAAVFKAFDIGSVWAPRVSHTTSTFERFLDAVDSEGLQIDAATRGKTITSGEAFSVDILSPDAATNYKDLNDWSVILRVTFKDESFLLTGDAGSQVILDAKPGHVDVLKASHHGSRTGTNKTLVNQLQPRFVVISCARGNDYGHPHKQTMNALNGITIFRTDTQGTITATTDGSDIVWDTEK